MEHVLLWIHNAPIIGKDDPDKVLAWIEEWITCHFPDKENNPELRNLVARYQLHKCSNYCKRKRKSGKQFVTACKFDFTREPSDCPKLHCVEESLKKRPKIYHITRTEGEVRVNDYNPLLLLLWKANMDIQFVSESSLALAHYVYLTYNNRQFFKKQKSGEQIFLEFYKSLITRTLGAPFSVYSQKGAGASIAST